MHFDRQAFISYTHLDNRPVATEEYGWVTLLHKALKNYLDRQLGRDAEIWRDERLAGNDAFPAEIAAKLEHTAVLVAVLSPRYFESEWCEQEIKRFCEVAEREGGLLVDNKCRVFKVLTMPVSKQEIAELQPELRDVLGYQFYELIDNQTPLELSPMYGEKFKADFLRKVAILATDIARIVKRLEGGKARAAGSARPTVYLASCSHDCSKAREIVRTELERMDCTVLPDRQLPTVEAEFVDTVQEMLALCSLSVHLVGSNYGMVPDGPSGKSVVLLQNELAVQRCHAGGLQRVIWLPDGTQALHPEQAAFMEALHTDAEAQFGADLITGNLETLKAAVVDAVEHLEQPRTAAVAVGRKQLSLICCEADRKQLVDVIKLLRQTVDVQLPVFSGDAGSVREANHEILMACDAAVLYYGAGDEAWKFHQCNELRRVRGLRRLRGERLLKSEYTLLASPNTDDKELLVALGEPCVVDLRVGLTSEAAVDIAAMLRELLPPGAEA